MPVAIGLDSSPASLLSRFRGTIIAVRVAYPEVLHVEVRDAGDGIWRLATQDANWSPSDPGGLTESSILSAEIDEAGSLRCKLSSGTSLVITPVPNGDQDDPPGWELIAPSGIALEFGPGLRWQIARADETPSDDGTT